MITKKLPALISIVLLGSCSSLKTSHFGSNRQTHSTVSEKSPNPRFIDDITIPTALIQVDTNFRVAENNFTANPVKGPNPYYFSRVKAEKEEPGKMSRLIGRRNSGIEDVSAVELKYSILLDMEVELLPNKQLLENVDEWYGVRYRSGGNSKKGVDCSGFVCAVYKALYGITLPKVSREQYRISRKISTTELQSGDLVFFNTTGHGVSHVGIYLGNNRFIHASVSKGVMVNNLFETYYLKRFAGAGRIIY